MRKAVLITTCAALVAAIGPATAAATPAPILDGDFAGGAFAGTHVFAGDLYTDETIWENQDFTTSPLGITWGTSPWPSNGSATVAGGALQVDGALAATNQSFDGPQSLRVPAIFANEAFQQIGLGTDPNVAPGALFTTGGGALPVGLYAHTPAADVPVEGVDPTVWHNYEIRWTTNRVTFFVDGRLVSTQDVTLPNGLKIVASDYDANGSGVSVDGVRLMNFVPAGTFVSRPLATGPGLVAWGALRAGGQLEGVSFETRTGRTPYPDGSWSPWQPLGPGGLVQSPLGYYIQYRATLNSLGGAYGARVIDVLIDLDADRVVPTARITGLSVGRTTAKVAFSSPDADVTRFECQLDGGAFGACASPKVFAGLKTGSRHTVGVRAIDHLGNAGAAVTRAFVTAKPKPPGPRVTLSPRSLRVAAAGRVAFRVGCPRSARRCKVALQLLRGPKAASTKRTVTVRGGRTAKARVRLSRSVRRYLRTHSRLNVTAVMAARDAAGHRGTRRVKVTLRARR